MKALFTADVHSDMGAWNRYAEILTSSEFHFGLIGGDLTDDSLAIQTIQELSQVPDDDLLEELYDPEDTIEDLDHRIMEYKNDPTTPLAKAARALEMEIKALLTRAQKPVFLIPGNHDRSDWEDTELIFNVHARRVELDSVNIVGYRYTSLDRSAEDEATDVKDLAKLVDHRTILMTHTPGYGVLDKNYRGISIGSKTIRRLTRWRRPLFHLSGHVHDSFGVRRHSANGAYKTYRSFIAVDTDARKLSVITS